VTVVTLSGTGLKNSDTFTISGGPTRLRWTTAKDLVLILVPGTGKLSTGEYVVNERTAGSGDTAIHTAAGTYYLAAITSSPWTVVIEEQR
jgi:hypothetical protein